MREECWIRPSRRDGVPWAVTGPADVVVVGATVDARVPSGRRVMRRVTIGHVEVQGGRTIGYPHAP